MAWTPTTFRAARPEFANTPDAEVETALADAAAETDARVFGASYDQAVSLLAAHLLSITPTGQPARLQKGELDTTYSKQREALARKRAGGPWATGQGPTGLLP